MFYDAQKAVEEFHRKYGIVFPNTPTKLPRTRTELRAKWMKEEIDEFLKADDIVEQSDAIADLIYFAIGVFIEMGIDGSEVFRLVHEANMNKLGKDGKPLYNCEGKVIKPSDWVSPKEKIKQWLESLT